MAEPDFNGFDWDEGNDTKSLKKHGVGKEVIEALFHASPAVTDDKRHSENEKRFVALGMTKERRWVIVAFTIRSKDGKNYVRPISARYMHEKEVMRYEKTHQGPKQRSRPAGW